MKHGWAARRHVLPLRSPYLPYMELPRTGAENNRGQQGRGEPCAGKHAGKALPKGSNGKWVWVTFGQPVPFPGSGSFVFPGKEGLLGLRCSGVTRSGTRRVHRAPEPEEGVTPQHGMVLCLGFPATRR